MGEILHNFHIFREIVKWLVQELRRIKLLFSVCSLCQHASLMAVIMLLTIVMFKLDLMVVNVDSSHSEYCFIPKSRKCEHYLGSVILKKHSIEKFKISNKKNTLMVRRKKCFQTRILPFFFDGTKYKHSLRFFFHQSA